jgi:hypothetical protein
MVRLGLSANPVGACSSSWHKAYRQQRAFLDAMLQEKRTQVDVFHVDPPFTKLFS